MNSSNKFLSDIVTFRTYAKYLPHVGRRESLEEIINRNMMMHLEKFPSLSRDIIKAYKQVHDLNVMPSMRSMQFGGETILKNNVKIYNCSFAAANYTEVFAESLYLLMCGTGFGFSVQRRHVSKLPSIRLPKEEVKYIVADSIEGWAESLNVLMRSYFTGGLRPVFDFSLIRAKGSRLSNGSTAPGHEPLKMMLEMVETKLKTSIGRKLRPIEVHDIMCMIADCVLSGGIRRAALISLFDKDEEEMLTSKQGSWWEKHPYRARANNSAVLERSTTSREDFERVFDSCIKSNAGEPGFSWTNDPDMGYNPCFTGDTLVAVADGRNAVAIKTLAEENYTGPIYSILNGSVTVAHCSKVWKTRENSELVKVTLDDGTSVRCTPDHRFMLRNGNYVAAKDLQPNTSLMPFNSYKRKDRDYRMISSNTGRDYAQYRYVAQYYDIKKDGYEAMHIHHKDGNGLNDSIENLEAINASVHNSEHKRGSNNPIHSFKNNELYREKRKAVTIGNNNPRSYGRSGNEMFENVYNKTKEYNRPLTRKEALECCNVKFLSKGRLDEMGVCSVNEMIQKAFKLLNHKVISVERLTEREDVYDLTVDVTHNFAVVTSMDDNAINSSGIFVHNCHEIALNSNQFCNLSSVNLTGIKNDKDLHNRVYAASLLGTLQAAYTDFPYLNENWKIQTEKEALIGVSFTGIADSSTLTEEQLQKSAKLVLEVNEKYAKRLGINPAARTTCVKPEGTMSCVVGSASGIHARYADHYIRRVRMNKSDALAKYLMSTVPELVEDDVFSASGVVVSIPQESPTNSITRHQETAASLLDRIIKYNKNWVDFGHRTGVNKHNVSSTISYKPEEVDMLRKRLWEEREHYTGISLLPFDNGSYTQAPFEECTKEVFEKMSAQIKNVNLQEVREMEDNTKRIENLACSGGICDLNI